MHKLFKARITKPLLLVLLALVVWTALPMTAAAHPLGNFTVNRYSRIEIGAAGVKVYYVLDMAEIPTFQEKDSIDLNRDGQISADEQQAYLGRKVKELQANLKLSLDDKPVELKAVAQDLSFLAGQGGLQTTRLTARFETGPLAENTTRLAYQDENYSDRLGWKEIVVRNATGVALVQSSAPATDQSNELRTYPEDMLASPLNVTSAQVGFRLDSSVLVNSASGSEADTVIKSQDPFAALVNLELTLPLILVALGAAFVLGAFHALSPGHGKTVVAAYLVGTRGTARHALFLGLTVTVTHTLGVFALGLVTLFAAQFIVPDKLYPWLGLLSGLIVLLMGLSLFRSRLRYVLVGAPAHSHDYHEHEHHGHDHSHDEHEHDHHHNDEHEHGHAHEHDHHYHNDEHDHSHQEAHSHQYQLEPAYAGRQPALAKTELSEAHIHPHHDHEDEHNHDDAHHHDHDHEHYHEHGAHVHSHGGKAHSHLPPGTDGTAITWQRLLFFGISAGLLPCPSALVVMLSAIALGRTAFGLVLIVFFSMGLAATLTGMGLLFVYARNLLRRAKINTSSRLIRLVPAASALVVALIGLVISYEALIQTGILK